MWALRLLKAVRRVRNAGHRRPIAASPIIALCRPASAAATFTAPFEASNRRVDCACSWLVSGRTEAQFAAGLRVIGIDAVRIVFQFGELDAHCAAGVVSPQLEFTPVGGTGGDDGGSYSLTDCTGSPFNFGITSPGQRRARSAEPRSRRRDPRHLPVRQAKTSRPALGGRSGLPNELAAASRACACSCVSMPLRRRSESRPTPTGST